MALVVALQRLLRALPLEQDMWIDGGGPAACRAGEASHNDTQSQYE
jgi:hypothetical protein